MPNFNFLERFPIPSVRNYILISSVLLSAAVYYAYDIVRNDDIWREQFKHTVINAGLSEETLQWLNRTPIARVAYFMISDQLCMWAVVNTLCLFLFLIGKAVQIVVFGKLRVYEQQLTRDRFWTYLFYKFVFIFGILNVQFLDEVLLWSIWFAVLGFQLLLVSLAHDRFKYVSNSPSGLRGSSPQVRILTLLICSLFSSIMFLCVAGIISHKVSMNYGGFLAAEAIILFFRALYGIIRYGLQLWDTGAGSSNGSGSWESRSSVTYYTDLFFELVILLTDFLHHLHMLIWSNIFLSMASLVICMQLRHLYQEIDRQLKRHRNHQRVLLHINENYPMASPNEIAAMDDNCAVCWDRMENARKLPCGHIFHKFVFTL